MTQIFKQDGLTKRLKDKELWVLVKVYIAPCGFVAHWFSHGGQNSFEPIDFPPPGSPQRNHSFNTHRLNAGRRG